MSTRISLSTRPRVVHAINNLGVGGVEAMCLEILRYFSQWADNALLVLDAKDQPQRHAFESLGLPIVTLDHHPGQQIKLIQKSYTYFRQNQTDALICWSFGNHAFISLGARLAGVSRVITSVQNAPPTDIFQQSKWRSLAWLGFLATSHLVACSNYVRDRLIQTLNLPASRVVAINNGCNVSKIHRRAQAEVTLKSDKIIIGMVARLDEIKDQATLIQAMPLVLEKHVSAELWLVGDGERRESLEKLTANLDLTENVKFLGTRHDIPELLGQMHVFAFSTTAAEGFGIVLAEALAAGVPVVASRVGPCAEVLQQGEWGCLVEPTNSDEFGEAILGAIAGNFKTPNFDEVYAAYDTEITSQRYWNLLFKGSSSIPPFKVSEM